MADSTLSHSSELLYSIPEWVLFLALAASLLAAAEIGRRLALSRRDELDRGQVATLQAALLGLLALLSGFTFGMAQTRFDARRLLLVDEVNAIGTAYLRAAALPPEEREPIERELHRYVATRARLSQSGTSEDELAFWYAAGERIQDEVWSRAAALARREPQSLPASLLLQALNRMIDVSGERLAAFRAHVPEMVIYVLAITAIVAMAFVGMGFAQMRGFLTFGSSVLLALLLSGLVIVILDLDRPLGGFIRVNQRQMFELQERLGR